MKSTNILTELAAHLRKQVKNAGIKARVRVSPTGGNVQISVPEYRIDFTEDEQRTIRTLAVNNRLTLVRGLPIDIERMTDAKQFDFYLPESEVEKWRGWLARWPSAYAREINLADAIGAA